MTSRPGLARQLASDAGRARLLLASLVSRKGPEKVSCAASGRQRMKTRESGTGNPCRRVTDKK